MPHVFVRHTKIHWVSHRTKSTYNILIVVIRFCAKRHEIDFFFGYADICVKIWSDQSRHCDHFCRFYSKDNEDNMDLTKTVRPPKKIFVQTAWQLTC